MLEPDAGTVAVTAPDGRAVDVREIERRSLWRQVMLLPQRPVLEPGSIESALVTARPGASRAELETAASRTGFLDVVNERGWDAEIGRDGSGLSLGELQRLALTRALLAPAPLVILDEPTAHLDGGTEATVIQLVRELRAEGRAVVVVAHRDALVAEADDVVELASRSREEALR